MQEKIKIQEPRARMHSVAGAFVVSAPLPDGTWIATFPHFIGKGPTEADAIRALAAELAGAARDVALLCTTGARPPSDPRDVVEVAPMGVYAGTATIEREPESAPTMPTVGDLFRSIETPREGVEREEYALVWARSFQGARRFFVVSDATPVKVIKEGPETDYEKRHYVKDAKLYGVRCEAKTFNCERATAGARRFK